VHLKEIGWEGVDWINLAYYRDQSRAVVNTVMNLRVLQNAGNDLSSWETVNFLRMNLRHGDGCLDRSNARLLPLK
jgi:hypothetical protein